MEKATVYFTNELTPEAVVKMYRRLGVDLPGKVAVKVHSGEDGNQNYLRPEFMKPVIDAVNGTVVECNTAYEGERNTTEKHRRTMIKHATTFSGVISREKYTLAFIAFSSLHGKYHLNYKPSHEIMQLFGGWDLSADGSCQGCVKKRRKMLCRYPKIPKK